MRADRLDDRNAALLLEKPSGRPELSLQLRGPHPRPPYRMSPADRFRALAGLSPASVLRLEQCQSAAGQKPTRRVATWSRSARHSTTRRFARRRPRCRTGLYRRRAQSSRRRQSSILIACGRRPAVRPAQTTACSSDCSTRKAGSHPQQPVRRCAGRDRHELNLLPYQRPASPTNSTPAAAPWPPHQH